MWTIFKITNLFAVLASAYIWVTANIPVLYVSLFLDVIMTVCVCFLPLQLKLDKHTGWILLAFVALIAWTVINESIGMGMGFICSYLPVFYLIALPREYQADLLRFVTKCISIALIPALIIHWILLFTPLPSLGTFKMEGYEPYDNYFFLIKTTYDYGTIIERFNAFFPEPGHMSMVCVFLMMANRFDFKRNKWMWVMLTAVVFSFSLAGYILSLLGFILLRINSLGKGLLFFAALTGFIIGVINFSGGDNAVNQLIFERLKYDQSKGIEGNNRFFNNTDFEFKKAVKSGDYWTGISNKTNMKLVSGAGFKIYILWHGVIGTLLIFTFYLSFIPPKPDWHYTLAYLVVIIACFVQNAYPAWYAWLFPYVLGLSLNARPDVPDSNETQLQFHYDYISHS